MKHHLPPWAKDESCLHNRDNLTPEQVGRGYRLVVDNDNTEQPHERWLVDQWVEAIPTEGTFKDYPRPTYRVPITVPWPPSPSEGPKTAGENLICHECAEGGVLGGKVVYTHKPQSGKCAYCFKPALTDRVVVPNIAHHEASKEKEATGIPTVEELGMVFNKAFSPNSSFSAGVSAVREAMLKAVGGGSLAPVMQRGVEAAQRLLKAAEARAESAEKKASDQALRISEALNEAGAPMDEVDGMCPMTFVERIQWLNDKRASAEAQLASLKEEHEKAKAMAAVCMDLHEALGVQWGEDPYFRIRELTEIATTPSDLSAARIALSAARQEAHELRQQLACSERERDDLKAKLAGAEAHIAALEGQLRELVKRRENDEAKLSATKEQLEETEAGLAEWVARAGRLQKKISQSPWISTSERLPTREDGDKDGHVFWLYEKGDLSLYLELRKPMSRPWNDPRESTHWMTIPPISTTAAQKEKPWTPKFKVGDRVRIVTDKSNDRVDEVLHIKSNGMIHLKYAAGLFLGSELEPAPWTLPAPPEGQQWHRSDGWTQEMLPDGWRPMLLGELPEHDDECMAPQDRIWYRCNHDARIATHGQSRTKRPLPTPKKRVPLEANDVPPGSVFTNSGLKKDEWFMVLRVFTSGIAIESRASIIPWDELLRGWQIKRPNEGWQECSKEEGV